VRPEPARGPARERDADRGDARRSRAGARAARPRGEPHDARRDRHARLLRRMGPAHGPQPERSVPRMNADREIAELVYQSCFLLDEMNFAGYLELCAADFRYRIVAYSPELRKDMVWQDVNREDFKHHVELIP